MAKAEKFGFEYPELAEILVKHQGIHEGFWGIYVEFGIAAANISISPSDSNLLPSAIVPVRKVGIQRFPKKNNLTVDAAEVNPE